MDSPTLESATTKEKGPMNTTSTDPVASSTVNQKASADLAHRVKEAERVQSMRQIVWNQFREHYMAVAGLIIIAVMISVALLAPVISKVTGLDPNDQNPLNRYLPANSRVTISSSQRETEIEHFHTEYPELAQALAQEIVDRNLFEVTRPEDALYELANKEMDEIRTILSQLETPDKTKLSDLVKGFENYHLLGTDELGRDVFIRLVWGTRVSIGVGILVACAAALVGLLIGSLAGFYGGWIDILLMRLTDSLLSLPQLPILIVVSAVSLEKLTDIFPPLKLFITAANESIVKLVFVVVIFSWMQVARLVRACVLSLKEREFILAARTLGASDRWIIVKHLFPNVMAPLLVSVTLGVGSSIQTEAALSFLGLGIQQPTPSWGNMLFNALEIMQESPLLIIVPGLLILLATISFNYLGDGLQDAIDPKAIRR